METPSRRMQTTPLRRTNCKMSTGRHRAGEQGRCAQRESRALSYPIIRPFASTLWVKSFARARFGRVELRFDERRRERVNEYYGAVSTFLPRSEPSWLKNSY